MRVTAAAAAVSVSLSGCIFLPAIAHWSANPPVPTPPTVPSAPPTVEPPTFSPTPEPTSTPSPSPTDEAQGIGELRDGNPLSSGSGLTGDTPLDLIIEPTEGSPTPGSVPNGNVSDARVFDDADGWFITQTTGRIYSTFSDDRVMTCSGTVVNTEEGNIVLTAAHCLYSAIYQEMAERVQFVPQEAGNGASAPHGTWEADRWVVPKIFADTATETDDGSSGDGWAFDYAWVRLHSSSSGRNVQEYTGGQGISFTQEFDGAQFVGYPTNPPFDGSDQRTCSSTQMGFGDMYWPHLTMDCTISPGISGSGWVTAIDPDSGAGYVGAVFSTLLPDRVSGAMIGADAYDLLLWLQDQ